MKSKYYFCFNLLKWGLESNGKQILLGIVRTDSITLNEIERFGNANLLRTIPRPSVVSTKEGTLFEPIGKLHKNSFTFLIIYNNAVRAGQDPFNPYSLDVNFRVIVRVG